VRIRKISAMKIVNKHKRKIRQSADKVFSELTKMGTKEDRIWPMRSMPFKRTEGDMKVNETYETHGKIKAVLTQYQKNKQITWTADLPFLKGYHAFHIIQHDELSVEIEHVLIAKLALWFVPVWFFKVRTLHDDIIESLFDNLEHLIV
jgi:hypothetical protein